MNKTCTDKEDCYPDGFVPQKCGTFYSCVNGKCAVGSKACASENNDCKNLYWFDNSNRACEQKEFCGLYMYQGLQTFESKTQCEKALNPEENKTFHLSNGRNAEIKIMPETASQKAIERLGELGFNIVLKEVGNDRVAYEFSAEKEGKMFGLFKVKGKVAVEVDAETGEVIKVRRPWWAFMASGI